MSNITTEQIELEIESFGSDSLEVVGGKWEGGINLQQIPDEISPCIFDLLKLRETTLIENFLEIGAAAGGNAFIFNYFFSFEIMVLIDNNRHKKHIHRESILSKVPHYEFIGDSHSKEADKFVENLGYRFDILFIDGDHSYEGVKKDTEMYLEFCSPNGFVIYHDTVACPGIKKYTEEISSNPIFRLVKEYISVKHPKPCGIKLFQLGEIE